MAVTEILWHGTGTPPRKYLGLSTDTKPMDDIPAGSKFTEINTGLKWIFDGTNWIEDMTLIYALTEALKEGGGT